MASQEHQDLADFIKSVHSKLRDKSRELGPDAAWHEHCSKQTLLQDYARAMRTLAVEYWDKNNQQDPSKCRIHWVVSKFFEYSNGRVDEALLKESKLATRLGTCEGNKSNNQLPSSSMYESHVKIPLPATVTQGKFQLLDVGSCYNPFKRFTEFQVTAIDIAPANENVVKCDFLHIQLVTDPNIDPSKPVFTPSSFDVVVFSLVLEYLPSPEHRYRFCENAYKVLKSNGTLFILSPDSKHATANSKLMKSWRIALAHIGFWREKYEKLDHLHCMMFRKCVNPSTPRTWSMTQLVNKHGSVVSKLLAIPQDNNKSDSDLCKLSSSDPRPSDEQLAQDFAELSYSDDLL